MGWRETCVMDQRVQFVAACLRGDVAMTALCEAYGISRKTGYKWLERYRADPERGLCDRSRAPHRPAQGIDAAAAAAILALRARTQWGPRKLKAKLEARHPERRWPAASSIGALLRREGCGPARPGRRRGLPVEGPFQAVTAPNDVWSIDFKGWFRTRDGTRCDPLTVSDAFSRYLLCCRIVAPTAAEVWPPLERLLREHGLPRALRSDNGPPFASTGAGGLSRLVVPLVRLGIRLERIAPGRPQQNGRHERLHRTLKDHTGHQAQANPAALQASFDRFVVLYNEERPHEALGQTPPAASYQASPRPFPSAIPEPWYDADHLVRGVRPKGDIKWGGEHVFISEALAGERVGVAETESGDWIVRFCNVDLGLIDRRTNTLRRFAAPRPGPRNAAATPEKPQDTVTHVPGP